ncbi:MAG TPA: YdcF family protein [Anaerolineaceae bacterium]
MFIFLSKFLPLLVYPLGLACILLIFVLLLRKHPRLRTTLVVFALAVLWLGGNRWVGYSLARSLEWQYLPAEEIPAAEALVVLGGGTEPALYPRASVEVNTAGDRVLYAGRLYKEGKAKYVLVSGGIISFLADSEINPDEDMADLLELTGVPRDAIWLQGESENTHDDAAMTAEILRQHGIDRVLLVTSAMHMPRSVALFEHEGIEVIPAPTDFTVTQAGWDALFAPNLPAQAINLLPNVSTLHLTTNILKEYIGIAVYRLRGWL